MSQYGSSDYSKDKMNLANHPSYKRVLDYEIRKTTEDIAKQILPEQIYRLQGKLQFLLEKKKEFNKARNAVSS